ncbi:MAG: Transcriptional regulator, LacI family [Chitinophagaceae bacterium]|nr:Transcriptional regulator, LacI family [Chitinophagaceae bacterium]
MINKKRPGITDIAKELNISPTSVSFILNGKAEEKRITKELAKKVLKYAKDHGYVTNYLAKSLRTGKSNVIGLIVENIANPFFAQIAGLIEENANQKGYKIFYCSSGNDEDKTRELIKVFRERQVDGYIITPVAGIEDVIETMVNDNCKLILFDRYFPSIKTNYVALDNFNGSQQAVDHLIEQGFKNIAFITIDSEQTQMDARLKGYKDALARHKRKNYIKKVSYNDPADKITKELRTFLKDNKEIDAVFFGTNYLGIDGLTAIKSLGLRIPEDIGVVCFDDLELFRLYTPAITVVDQPIEKMSEKLINILLENLDSGSENLPLQQLLIKPHLNIRNSSLGLLK